MPYSTIKPDPFYDRTVELAALDRAWKWIESIKFCRKV
jgi:hypothetical protein